MNQIDTVYVVLQLEPIRMDGPHVRAVCATLGSAEQYIRREIRQHPEIRLELDISEMTL